MKFLRKLFGKNNETNAVVTTGDVNADTLAWLVHYNQNCQNNGFKRKYVDEADKQLNNLTQEMRNNLPVQVMKTAADLTANITALTQLLAPQASSSSSTAVNDAQYAGFEHGVSSAEQLPNSTEAGYGCIPKKHDGNGNTTFLASGANGYGVTPQKKAVAQRAAQSGTPQYEFISRTGANAAPKTDDSGATNAYGGIPGKMAPK